MAAFSMALVANMYARRTNEIAVGGILSGKLIHLVLNGIPVLQSNPGCEQGLHGLYPEGLESGAQWLLFQKMGTREPLSASSECLCDGE